MNIYNRDQMDRLADNRIAVECNGDPALYNLYFKKCDNCGLIWEVTDVHYVDGSNNTVVFCTICSNNHYSELLRRQRDTKAVKISFQEVNKQ